MASFPIHNLTQLNTFDDCWSAEKFNGTNEKNVFPRKIHSRKFPHNALSMPWCIILSLETWHTSNMQLWFIGPFLSLNINKKRPSLFEFPFGWPDSTTMMCLKKKTIEFFRTHFSPSSIKLSVTLSNCFQFDEIFSSSVVHHIPIRVWEDLEETIVDAKPVPEASPKP